MEICSTWAKILPPPPTTPVFRGGQTQFMRGWGPEGWGGAPKGGAPKGGAPKGGAAKPKDCVLVCLFVCVVCVLVCLLVCLSGSDRLVSAKPLQANTASGQYRFRPAPLWANTTLGQHLLFKTC